MNKYLDEAILDIAKVDAIMYAIDQTYMEDTESRRQYLFYAMWDAVQRVRENLDRLAEDQKVVDAIYAVNDVRKQRTLKNDD